MPKFMGYSKSGSKREFYSDTGLPQQTRKISNKQFFVYEVGGNVTSCVCKMQLFDNEVAHLTAVYTFPKYRGNGYARQMIYQICSLALQTSCQVSLFVDKSNPISNRVYQNVGFGYLTANFDYRIIPSKRVK